MLSLAGGIAGLLIAIWGSDALVALQPAGIPRIGEVRVDASVIAFLAIVAVLTGLLFGSIPAVQITRGALVGALKESGRSALAAGRVIGYGAHWSLPSSHLPWRCWPARGFHQQLRADSARGSRVPDR